jgi:hypothetical protein
MYSPNSPKCTSRNSLYILAVAVVIGLLFIYGDEFTFKVDLKTINAVLVEVHIDPTTFDIVT